MMVKRRIPLFLLFYHLPLSYSPIIAFPYSPVIGLFFDTLTHSRYPSLWHLFVSPSLTLCIARSAFFGHPALRWGIGVRRFLIFGGVY